MAHENWGRWGEHDEIGALNLVGADEILAATTLIRQGKVASLAQPLSKKTPVPNHRAGLLHFMSRDGGDYAAGARSVHGFQFAEDSVVMPLHFGTHIDALCHTWCEDQLYNGHASSEITSTHGAKKCGVDKLPPSVTRGVLLDIAKRHGSPLPDGYSIDVKELKDTAELAGVELKSGDAVLIRTGWLEDQAGKRAQDVNFNEEPGIDVSAALWLANSGAVMVGADNYAIEAMPFPEGTIFPVHQRLIRDYGISLLEGLALQGFAQLGINEFMFVAAPLPIVGGTGSPITPLAIF
jgi:kynurenine formamidase